MTSPISFDALLRRQAQALGRHLKPTEIFRRTMERQVSGRTLSEIIRRISPPNRYRDDVLVDGVWRFSEGFDGAHAWFRDKNHPNPTEATGRASAAHRWAGTLLDHLRPLKRLKTLGCTLRDCGVQSTVRGQRHRAVQIAMLDYFAETVFIDEDGRIIAHHWDLPPAEEEDRELEVCVDDWGEYDRLIHPVRSTVLDRANGGTVAEIVVTTGCVEPYVGAVFDLSAD